MGSQVYMRPNIYDEMGLSCSMGESMALCVSAAEFTRQYLSTHTRRVALCICIILPKLIA